MSPLSGRPWNALDHRGQFFRFLLVLCCVLCTGNAVLTPILFLKVNAQNAQIRTQTHQLQAQNHRIMEGRRAAIRSRDQDIKALCDQISGLRTSLVHVLEDSEKASLKRRQRGLDPDSRKAQRIRKQIDAFYAPQIARVSPVRCP